MNLKNRLSKIFKFQYLEDKLGWTILFAMVMTITWIINLIQVLILFFNNDEMITKHLVIHMIGLYPPLSLITIWL